MDQGNINVSAIVIDAGSGYTKVGMSGEDAPKTSFPTIVGRNRIGGISISLDQKDTFVGNEAHLNRGILDVTYPVKRGLVEDWEGIEKIWHHSFYHELMSPPEEHPVLITETPKNPAKHREKLAELAFEVFNVPALVLGNQPVLSLYSTGKTTGVVLDSGHEVTHTVPVFEGYSLPHSIVRNEIGGKDITEFLLELLKKNGISLNSVADIDIVQDIKEKSCYVAYDYENEINFFSDNSTKDVNFVLPDGNIIALNNQQFKAPESLFLPELINKDLPGVHEMLYQSIMKSDSEIRKDLTEQIVLTGGSTLFPRIKERIAKEMADLAPGIRPKNEWKVIAPGERKYTIWIGGSILASLSTFSSMWVSDKDYQEHGKSYILKKTL